jgi:hypothetical protein
MYNFYSFLTSALDGSEWSASRPYSSHWIGGWVGRRAGLDTEARGKILCLYWGSNPNCLNIQSIVRCYNIFKILQDKLQVKPQLTCIRQMGTVSVAAADEHWYPLGLLSYHTSILPVLCPLDNVVRQD